MKIIYTSKGEEILCDDEDYEWLNQYTWTASRGQDDAPYAITSICHPTKPGRRMQLRMHRLVMGLKPSDRRKVDHIFHRTLDNRKSQLRVCTHAQNLHNSNLSKRNRSGYKGVSLFKATGRWVAYIRHNGKHKHLGFYETAEEAYAVRCLAADLLHGEFVNYG